LDIPRGPTKTGDVGNTFVQTVQRYFIHIPCGDAPTVVAKHHRAEPHVYSRCRATSPTTRTTQNLLVCDLEVVVLEHRRSRRDASPRPHEGVDSERPVTGNRRVTDARSNPPPLPARRATTPTRAPSPLLSFPHAVSDSGRRGSFDPRSLWGDLAVETIHRGLHVPPPEGPFFTTSRRREVHT